MSTPQDRLAELGITLPNPIAPLATYVPFVWSGSHIFVSGQVSYDPSGGVSGIIGEDLTLEQGVAAARMCGINILTQLQAATGDLSRIRRLVKLTGFVQAGPAFFDIPTVINGCSDLMVEVFGDAGRHARSAVGVYRLPRNFAVEVECIAEAA